MPSNDRHINFALMRDRILGKKEGKQFWRSLEELSDSPEFREFVEREYPQHAEEWDSPVERRTFLKLMGASLALAGLSGCVYQPPEKIVPYVNPPEDAIPGKPKFYATAMTLRGVAMGLLARSSDGRPTKIEGNPDHPDSLGATNVWAQASLLDLYDPDRLQTITYLGQISPWTRFLGEMQTVLNDETGRQGSGIRFLTETVTSPTFAAEMKQLLTALPQAKWHQYEPASRNSGKLGAMMSFGQPVNVTYDFEKADRIFSIDADFLRADPGNLRYTRGFARRRKTQGDDINVNMNRLYVVESTLTITGAKADHRLAMRPSQIEGVVRAVAAGLGVKFGGDQGAAGQQHANFITAMVKDLQSARGKSIIIAGDEQPPAVHALAHAMNDALGNVGSTVFYTDPVEANPVDQVASLKELVEDLNSGRVETLVILGGNPVYNAPADFGFANAMQKAKRRIHLSSHNDETSQFCQWNVPQSHYLESWGDARAFDGTVTIIQPLIEPLYQSKSPLEMLMAFTQHADIKAYDQIRNYWRTQITGGDFEEAWRKAVHDGVVPNTALPARTMAVKTDWSSQPQPVPANSDQLEVTFRTDPSLFDGRFANNGWLQELPKPITHITWDNVAYVSPRTARELGLNQKEGYTGGKEIVDTINISYRGATINNVPAWILPGQPDGVITLTLGYGRTFAGRAGTGVGYNAYSIRTADSPWTAYGATVKAAGTTHVIASTQLHYNMENRHLVRIQTLDEYKKNPKEASELEPNPPRDETFYKPEEHDSKKFGFGYGWGMAIDTSSCVGCNACVAACVSENNIPVVGKEQVQRGREMQWLRIDAYYGDEPDKPEGPYFMPVPCMHCENAPCEPVCPVHATVHSAEGINDMVYNRCVGTRYCSNNCPYKVRRFNFLLYQDWNTETYKLMRNPEVTVRSRGVMEKCTYCIQRIQNAKIESEKEGRRVRDGEIVTACAAACPADAIVFGDKNDPNSEVSKWKAQGRNYSLLAELNTQPRTTYLSALRNPNPEITEKA
jgi:molybdopterin-containing oxidoreductase family iron-sulfur binding subunit